MEHAKEFYTKSWCFYFLTFDKHDVRLGIEIGTHNIDISILKLGFGCYKYTNFR